MIVVTGAAGFIGSCLAGRLNRMGITDLLLVDDFSRKDKEANLQGKGYTHKQDREIFLTTLKDIKAPLEFVLHIGARTDTTEMNPRVFDHLNLNYSKRIWEWCSENHIPLVYASSAATYGAGEHGYSDSHEIVSHLRPLNPYGESKNEFDKWVLMQEKAPPFWAGLKFFNVFGPNEYHKGRMASVIYHAFNQISEQGQLKLFRSHRADFSDGGQLRDFVYIQDLLDVVVFMMQQRPESGIYNLGTGKARSFYDLGTSVFQAMDKPVNIAFIDTPIDIRDKYQYYTQADMSKLRAAGYDSEFMDLEEAVKDYVGQFLSKNARY